MSDPKDLPLEWFGKLQLNKLSSAKNVAKSHWLDMSMLDLIQLLRDEMDELEEALCDGNPAAITDECIDVANFAVMIAHFVRED